VDWPEGLKDALGKEPKRGSGLGWVKSTIRTGSFGDWRGHMPLFPEQVTGVEAAEPAAHFGAAGDAGVLENGCAAPEDDEVGDGRDVEAAGETGLGEGEHLQDKGLSGHFVGQFANFGFGLAARRAPGGPEIDDYRDVGGRDDFIEGVGVDIERGVDGGEGGFAVAAVAGVGEVAGGDAILRATGAADGDDGEGHSAAV